MTWSQDQPQITLPEYTPYRSGFYTAYAAPFGVNSGSCGQGLTSPADYLTTITVTPSRFPNDTRLLSNWPDFACKTGVFGFVKIDFGDYANSTPAVPIASQSIGAVTELRHTATFTRTGSSDALDLIYDMFLTSQSGSKSTRLWEVEVFLHSPRSAITFFGAATPLGSYKGDGRQWQVAIAGGNDILVMPSDRGDFQGTFDMKMLFNWLTLQGCLKGSEFFNGDSIGIESTIGAGSVTLDTFSTTYR